MTFLALRCYACGMFQVKQQKKSSNKWCCSVCNEKQSVCKVYGSSAAAKDVRALVQSLNMSNRDMEELQEIDDDAEIENAAAKQSGPSKWDDYLEQDNEQDEHEECDENEKLKFVTALPDVQCRRRKIATSGGGSRKRSSTLRESTKKQMEMEDFFGSAPEKPHENVKNNNDNERNAAAAAAASKRLPGNNSGYHHSTLTSPSPPASFQKSSPATSKSKWSTYLEDDASESTTPSSGSYSKWAAFRPQQYVGEVSTVLDDDEEPQ